MEKRKFWKWYKKLTIKAVNGTTGKKMDNTLKIYTDGENYFVCYEDIDWNLMPESLTKEEVDEFLSQQEIVKEFNVSNEDIWELPYTSDIGFDELKNSFETWMGRHNCDLEKVSKIIDRIRIERETGIKVK